MNQLKVTSTRRALILFTRDLVKDARQKKLASSSDSQVEIYRYFLKHLSEVIITARQGLNFDLIIATDASDTSTQAILQQLDTDLTLSIKPHPGVDFNTNISAALQQTAGKEYEQVVIIGNDCLDLTSDHITSAFDSLTYSEAVLGTAKDGGFYLLGLTCFENSLFEGIRWGGRTVSEKLLANLNAIGLQVDQLPSLGDIDNAHDLKSWIRSSLNSVGSVSYGLAQKLKKLILSIPLFFWVVPGYSSSKVFSRVLQQLPPPSFAS